MGTKGINKEKIIVVLGPTSSGKSDLAVKLAQKFGGEIISADSRQVYRGMDIGSGKISKKEMQGIPHYLLDVANPKRNFSAARYQKMAEEAINKISKKGKIPIICGGTAFYIKSVTEGMVFPKVKPDWKLRKKLEEKSVDDLYKILKKIDPRRSKNIEIKNPRRLIRSIEIALKSKKPIPALEVSPRSNVLKIGIIKNDLEKVIKKRLLKRIKKGMLKETKNLKDSGLSWKRIENFGLEYKWTSKYLKKEISREEMIDKLYLDIIRFSKKQMTWFKKDPDILWVRGYWETSTLVKNFLFQKKER